MSKELTLSIRLAKGSHQDVLDLKMIVRPMLIAVLIFSALFASIWFIGFTLPLFVLSSVIVGYWIILKLRGLFEYEVDLDLQEDDKTDIVREIQLFE